MLVEIAKRVVLNAPLPALRLIGGPPRISDEGAVLDRQAQAILGLQRRLRMPEIHELPPAGSRVELEKSTALTTVPGVAVDSVEDFELPRAGGLMKARLYLPRGGSAAPPGLLYMHGGGFVVGSIETHDSFCRRLCRDAECGVLSLDYRLAPEDPWPAAPDDARAAWRWLVDHARILGLDPDRLAVGGDSAGGNLAALVAIDARDSGVQPPVLQLLLYPGVDLTWSHASHTTFSSGYFLSRPMIEWFIGHYLPEHDLARDPRVSPWFVDDLAGVARAVVVIAGFDPLRDEGRAYANRLATAGVEVELHAEPTLIHGFVNMDGVIEAAATANARIVRLVRAAF